VVQNKRTHGSSFKFVVHQRFVPFFTEMTLNKLQRVHNNLSRAVCRRGSRADARPLLKSLHWLPVNERTYRVAVLTYKLRSTSISPYLSTLLQSLTSSRSLRSVDTGSLRLQLQPFVLSSACVRHQQCGTLYLTS